MEIERGLIDVDMGGFEAFISGRGVRDGGGWRVVGKCSGCSGYFQVGDAGGWV